MYRDDWKPLVSIIIVNWNRYKDILETLENVKNFDYENLEIIVIENGSTDDSLKVLKESFKEIKLIALPNNLGCEDGNNVGILNANGEIIVFLDSDAGLEENGISKIINAFKTDPKVGIVEPRIIRPADNKIINEPKTWPINNTFTGCVVAFKAEVFEKIGLRPGEFFIYGSEPDISLKAVEHDYRILHCSDILGEHRESPAARFNKRFYYYSTRNSLWLIWRHYPLLSAIYETIFLLVLYFVRSMKDIALHYYILGFISAVIGIRKQIIGKRNPLTKFNEARLFPGMKDLLRIIKEKISNN